VTPKEARMSKSATDLVAEARGRIENLSVDEVADEMERGDAVLVDLREPAELAATGRIPGSVHVPRGMLEFRADPTSPYHQDPLDPSRRVILHCVSGGRSALAAATLKDMGYSSVAHLDGGITAWKEAGRPTE
jgi:rhodanese-related sulfurtransferase